MARWHEFGYYPPSRPREAKGGIKAQSKRGAFASSWWGQRWIATLESFPIGARLGRGRSYARKGQVISLEIDKGRVTAEVQGSRTRPYAVSITMKPIATSKWRKIAKQASENLLVAAKLMAGEMPPEIEEVFADVRAPLFPTNQRDLATKCSCPDWSNPCKHVAAVYYLLAEAFDRDPLSANPPAGHGAGRSRRAARAGRHHGRRGDTGRRGPSRARGTSHNRS